MTVGGVEQRGGDRPALHDQIKIIGRRSFSASQQDRLGTGDQTEVDGDLHLTERGVTATAGEFQHFRCPVHGIHLVARPAEAVADDLLFSKIDGETQLPPVLFVRVNFRHKNL